MPFKQLLWSCYPESSGFLMQASDHLSPQQFCGLHKDVQEAYLRESRNIEILGVMARNSELIARMMGIP